MEKVYTDGAFQSPCNDEFCQNIDMVFTGVQGAASRYDMEMTTEGLQVTDTKTGEELQATLAKKLKNSTEDRWHIRSGEDKVYFNQKAIRTSCLRRAMKQRPKEESQKRNKVETTIFHVVYPLKSGKSKYRGLIKNQAWEICRCFWVNLVRIIRFLEQTCQRTLQKSEKTALALKLWFETILRGAKYNKLAWLSSIFAFVIFYNTFNQFFKTYFLQ